MQGGFTALLFAARNGHLQVVQKLLKSGADTDVKDTVMQGDGGRVGVGNEGWVHAWWRGVCIGTRRQF